jgi:AAA domain
MPNPPSDFLKFADTPFEGWILPIIPAKATLKPREDGKPGIAPENLGKIPGRYVASAGAWVGFINWQSHWADKNDLERWQGWQTHDTPIAIGMRTAEFPVVDIDSDDPEIVEAIQALASRCLGWSPVRRREDSPRRVLCYKWTPGPNRDRAPVRKMRFAFTDKEDKVHVVEILGSGQQVVIEGPHAKGKMHYWLDGKGLKESHGELVDIAAEEASKFLTAVREWTEEQGFASVKLTLPTVSDRATAVKIEDATSEHRATDMELLARCVRAIDINDEQLADYDAWIALLVAIKAAAGGDRDFFLNVVWPWLEGNAQNAYGIEEMEAKWNSFRDSRLGAEFVYRCAATFGFTEGVHAITEEMFRDAQSAADSRKAPGDDSVSAMGDGQTISGTNTEAQQPGRRGAPIPRLLPEGFDPRKLPRRPFVLGYRFMTGAVTLGVAPPGTGKSNFSILTALSIATGQALTGEPVHRAGPVWIHNNEDSLDELYRRVSGALKFHQIEFDDVREKIFATSGLDERLVVALKDQDIVKRTKAVADVIASISENGIIHMVIDPLVSTHRGVSENSNEEIEQVAETIRYIAHETGCSIDLVHHSIKSHAGNTESHAGDMNAARGASALIGAVRIMYTLSPMSRKTASDLNIPPQLSARLMRLDQGKGNYSAHDPSIRWFELVAVPIGNGADDGSGFELGGDTVAVPVRWHPSVGNGDAADDSPKRR